MWEAGLWKAKRRSMQLPPTPGTAAAAGELVQIDGSPHDWFEASGRPRFPCWSLERRHQPHPGCPLCGGRDDCRLTRPGGEYIGRHSPPQAASTVIGTASSGSMRRKRPNRRFDPIPGAPWLNWGSKDPAPIPPGQGASGAGQRRLARPPGQALMPVRHRQLGSRQCIPCRISGRVQRPLRPASREPEDAHAPACTPERLRSIPGLKEARKPSRQLTCQYHQQWLQYPSGPRVGEPAGGRHGGTRAHLDGALRSSMPTARFLRTARYPAFRLLVMDAKVVQARTTPAKSIASTSGASPSPSPLIRVMVDSAQATTLSILTSVLGRKRDISALIDTQG